MSVSVFTLYGQLFPLELQHQDKTLAPLFGVQLPKGSQIERVAKIAPASLFLACGSNLTLQMLEDDLCPQKPDWHI